MSPRVARTRKPKTKQVVMHYRRAEGSLCSGITLQDALASAMDSDLNGRAIREQARERLCPVDSGELFLNWYYDDDTDIACIMGDLTLFAEGETQPLLESGGFDRSFVEVRQKEAPPNTEYVDSILYWMIKDNHVFIIQTPNIRSDAFEAYVSWLICEKSKVVDPPADLLLVNKFDRQAIRGGLEEIREIIIGDTTPGARSITPGLPTEVLTAQSSQDLSQTQSIEHHDLLSQTTSGKGRLARALLSAVFVGQGKLDESNNLLDKVPDSAELTVAVHIGYKVKKSKDKTPMREIERNLRHMPDEFIKVKAKDGQSYANGKLRLQVSKPIELEGEWRDDKWVGSLLNRADVARVFVSAYTEMVGKEQI